MTNILLMMAQQVSHTVQRGETLDGIAKKYNVSVYALKNANPDMVDMPYVGMKLIIPKTTGNDNTVSYSSVELQGSDMGSRVGQHNVDNNVGVVPDNSFVESDGLYVCLNPKLKAYSFDIASNYSNFLYGAVGLGGVFVKNAGSFNYHMGFGLGGNYLSDPVMIIANAYPYFALTLYDKPKAYNEKKGEMETETKFEFAYGACINLGLGLHVYESKSKKYYLSGGYRMEAPKFELNNMFDNGVWWVGITLVDK